MWLWLCEFVCGMRKICCLLSGDSEKLPNKAHKITPRSTHRQPLTHSPTLTNSHLHLHTLDGALIFKNEKRQSGLSKQNGNSATCRGPFAVLPSVPLVCLSVCLRVSPPVFVTLYVCLAANGFHEPLWPPGRRGRQCKLRNYAALMCAQFDFNCPLRPSLSGREKC